MGRCFGLMARPSREFAPAGDLLFERPESRQKVAPAKPPLRGSLRCSKPGAAPNSLRYAPFKQRGAKSVLEARCARAPGFCASRRFRRGVTEQPTAEQPNSKTRNPSGGRISLTPFSTAEQRKDLRARAQHASTSDSAQLSDRSVAEGVLRGPSRPEQRREPAAKRREVRPGGALCLLSGGPESRSPAGAKSPLGLARKTKQRRAQQLIPPPPSSSPTQSR